MALWRVDKMNVLSLFDGISCGQLALNKAGIEYDKYYASEIDDYAIKIAQKNYPNTIQLGDITNISNEQLDKLPKIDLILGGSPCQGFSYSGKGLNFSDPRSKLFFEFDRILKNILSINPKVKFLFENVRMKKGWHKIISEFLGCEPIYINSSLLSAQSRPRLYWTNVEGVEKPKDKGLAIKDILEKDKDKEVYPAAIRGRRIGKNGSRKDNSTIPITQYIEFRQDGVNSNCLTTVDKDNIVCFKNPGHRLIASENRDIYRNYTIVEIERLQTLPDNYTEGGSKYKRKQLVGNGWTVDVIVHILKTFYF